jgi:hypothetical protein
LGFASLILVRKRHLFKKVLEQASTEKHLNAIPLTYFMAGKGVLAAELNLPSGELEIRRICTARKDHERFALFWELTQAYQCQIPLINQLEQAIIVGLPEAHPKSSNAWVHQRDMGAKSVYDFKISPDVPEKENLVLMRSITRSRGLELLVFCDKNYWPACMTQIWRPPKEELGKFKPGIYLAKWETYSFFRIYQKP